MGVRPEAVDALTRLCIVGVLGMGAPEYRPVFSLRTDTHADDWDTADHPTGGRSGTAVHAMCFNVFAHNRDDHSSNFSFLCENGTWRLFPAYDLTYSNSLGGKHATTVAGEGKNPTMKGILAVGKTAGLRESVARAIAERIQETVNERLAAYLHSSV